MAASTPAASGRIFISYRREETAYPAGWLYDRLADRYGGGQVFKDVDSIQLGDDFVEAITRAVGSCDVVLVLIGDEWTTIADDGGRRRLDDPDDFVRLEVQAALTRNVRVIPILVDGARMPRADELPGSIAKLVRRQALEFSPARFEFDTSRLFKVLDGTLAEMRRSQDTAGEQGTAEEQGPTAAATGASDSAPGGREALPRKRGRFSPRTLILGGTAAVVVVILLVVLLVTSLQKPSPSANPAEGQAPVQAGGGGIDVDSSPVTSGDGIRLSGLQATSRRDPAAPRVGDTVTVSYALTNTTDQPLQLEYTFVGVRDASGNHHDTEDMNEGRALAPGETVNAQGRVLLNSSGSWEMWPCYVLTGERFCPDKWQVFFVLAQ
ncbi:MULTISPECIES: toll/interleukin-1 receptor domain-containing protein [unclassified Arthrobacter]|uniref:toll/interleukin-1 receptor domain-containing protein n=1 Tax=unclassified Arthrobacter TaxID=235627 RepID=UPI001C850718|nr:toll/interleukin-1 receptor domain-containing protein [Arthrobacter sp. MAHUQ-56]MBX7442936.1 toll/interleukin-1 receptor domain-containing protein [Arthrobacter sp. MAHUQ-56]